jgi:DNA-binding GntR family transcriptional regulator
MATKKILNLVSLKDQVYEYLRDQMKKGELLPGSAIDMTEISTRLGISRTPLRDALLRLENEGFVNIFPRKGIQVSTISLQDIRDFYQIIGALESTAVLAASIRFRPPHIQKMQILIEKMKDAIAQDEFDRYYEKNLEFHAVYIDLSGNRVIKKTVETLKKRLYDFPRPKEYIREWEEHSIQEHENLIMLLSKDDFVGAGNYIRDVHWSFEVQEKYLRRYYLIDKKAG